MEFHDLGQHCSAENCNQQDFLPFTCNGCSRVFCLDHRTHTNHSCANANFNDKRVLECSLCSKVLKVQSGVPREVALRRHIASGCVEGVRKTRPNKLRCSAAGCRGSEFVKISCKSCNKNFCFRHRHEDDHKCEAVASQPPAPNSFQRRNASTRRVTEEAVSAAAPSVGTGANGRGCGVEAGAAAARRAAAAEGRRATDGAKTAGRGGRGITAH